MCEAKIRPFPDDTELQCERDDDEHRQTPHAATLKDYAYPGSETRITWWEDDRRNFRGEYQDCDTEYCVLPNGHHGDHSP